MSQQYSSDPVEDLLRDTLRSKLSQARPRRDLWPSIQVNLTRPRKRRNRRWLVRMSVAVGIALVFIALSLGQFWRSESPSPLSPAGAIAHAFEGLRSLDTVHYRVEGENSYGDRFVQLFQLDIVNQILYSKLTVRPPAGGGLSIAGTGISHPGSEMITIGGKQYSRTGGRRDLGGQEADFAAGWRFMQEVHGWQPFSGLGGIPFGGEDALEEWFDEVRRMPDTELTGVPVAHYIATRTITEPWIVQDTVELWVRIEDSLLERVDSLHQERWDQSTTSLDLGKDWCEGLGELTEMAVLYGTPGSRKFVLDPPAGSSLQPVKVSCFKQDGSLGRTVWQRSGVPPGEDDYDLTVHSVYTFTAFNQPLTLPSPLPTEGR